MILKLITSNDSKKGSSQMEVWIQKDKDFNLSIIEILRFFKENIKIYKKWRFHMFYKITSENPAILLSLFSALQELIPEIYLKEI
jgi:hypothetical protein